MNHNLKIFLYTVALFCFLVLIAGPIGFMVFFLTFFQCVLPAIIYHNTTNEKQQIEDAIKDNEEHYKRINNMRKEYSKRLNLINEKNKLGVRLDYDDDLTLRFLDYYSVERIEREYKERQDKINERVIKLKENKK